jgi:hypothetical protein
MPTKSETAQLVAKAAELRATGAYQADIGAALGVDQSTISRALAKAPNYMDSNQLDILASDQFLRISRMWCEIEADKTMTSAEKHRAWATWMRLEIDLTGTAAPSKSIQAHVSSKDSGWSHADREACAGLNEEQRESVRVFARSIPRIELPMPAGPPTLLLEGEEK